MTRTVFRDKTYCASDCVNRDCDKNLTPDIRAVAEMMWGKNPPIDVADYRTGCGEYTAPRPLAEKIDRVLQLRQALDSALNWWADDAFQFDIESRPDQESRDCGYAWSADVTIHAMQFNRERVSSTTITAFFAPGPDEYRFTYHEDAHAPIDAHSLPMFLLLDARDREAERQRKMERLKNERA